jgi:hypothetical protein
MSLQPHDHMTERSVPPARVSRRAFTLRICANRNSINVFADLSTGVSIYFSIRRAVTDELTSDDWY